MATGSCESPPPYAPADADTTGFPWSGPSCRIPRQRHAVEEHPDGSENSATEELMWDYEGNDVVITLTRD